MRNKLWKAEVPEHIHVWCCHLWQKMVKTVRQLSACVPACYLEKSGWCWWTCQGSRLWIDINMLKYHLCQHNQPWLYLRILEISLSIARHIFLAVGVMQWSCLLYLCQHENRTDFGRMFIFDTWSCRRWSNTRTKILIGMDNKEIPRWLSQLDLSLLGLYRCTFLLTYLLTYLLTDLLTYLLTYLLTMDTSL